MEDDAKGVVDGVVDAQAKVVKPRKRRQRKTKEQIALEAEVVRLNELLQANLRVAETAKVVIRDDITKQWESDVASLKAKIEQLEKEKAAETRAKDTFYNSDRANTQIIDGIHDVLDDFGIRRYRDENKYDQIPLTVRLFAWAMRIGAGMPMTPKA